jgi:hypothetical protein
VYLHIPTLAVPSWRVQTTVRHFFSTILSTCIFYWERQQRPAVRLGGPAIRHAHWMSWVQATRMDSSHWYSSRGSLTSGHSGGRSMRRDFIHMVNEHGERKQWISAVIFSARMKDEMDKWQRKYHRARHLPESVKMTRMAQKVSLTTDSVFTRMYQATIKRQEVEKFTALL